jgi:hypothetical protein
MHRITRAIAGIATGGVVAGGAAALVQAPPRPAKTANTANSQGDDANAAVTNLLAESAQLHAAVDAAKSQLAQLTGDPASGATTDLAAVLANQTRQLAAARAALAAAEQQLAKDEALLAALHAGGSPGQGSRPPATNPTTLPAPARTQSARPTNSPTPGPTDD